jgi:hypothetical protein
MMSEPMVPESDYLHMKAEVKRLTAELAERDKWIERCMSMAHVTSLFAGGRGEGDPVVGFREILRYNDELIAANDAAEAREKVLQEKLIDRDAEIQFLRQEGLT